MNQTTTDIIHITSPENALSIIIKKAYTTYNNPGHYDAGMNFLGILGEHNNTHPTSRGSKIHCEWLGKVSCPLPYNATSYHTPNILFDFNGSGYHYPNNDPRYFLPYDSEGLIVRKVELEKDYDKESFTLWWAYQKGWPYTFLHKFKFFHSFLLKKSLKHLQNVNNCLATQETKISIQRKK